MKVFYYIRVHVLVFQPRTRQQINSSFPPQPHVSSEWLVVLFWLASRCRSDVPRNVRSTSPQSGLDCERCFLPLAQKSGGDVNNYARVSNTEAAVKTGGLLFKETKGTRRRPACCQMHGFLRRVFRAFVQDRMHKNHLKAIHSPGALFGPQRAAVR